MTIALDTDVDIAIVGAGAAGMLAAWQAAQGNATVSVFEKANKPGVKILMSGGTRCNITHDCDAAGIMRAFGPNGRFLRQALAAWGPSDVVAMFERLGVPSKVEPGGKVFPVSDRALDVCQALVRQMTASGVTLHLGSAVTSIQRHENGFQLAVNDAIVRASVVIVTVGGQSYPGCGTTGDGYSWLRGLGHQIVTPAPALVPIVGGYPWSQQLQGVTLPEATVSVHRVGVAGKKSVLASRTGGLLFTHFGFSGPAAMDVSGAVSAQASASEVELGIQVVHGWNDERVGQYLDQQRVQDGKQSVVRALQHVVPKRLAEAMSEQAQVDPTTPLAQLSKAGRKGLVQQLGDSRFPLLGTRGFAKAEVTAGGVSLAEIDPRTMQSRITPGLFVAGELLDLDGWIGGYNFQSAFSTGFVAGRSANAYFCETVHE